VFIASSRAKRLPFRSRRSRSVRHLSYLRSLLDVKQSDKVLKVVATRIALGYWLHQSKHCRAAPGAKTLAEPRGVICRTFPGTYQVAMVTTGRHPAVGGSPPLPPPRLTNDASDLGP
jgi:hypothetical protein